MTEHDGVNDPLNQFRERRREATTITLEDCAICNDSPELHRGGLLQQFRCRSCAMHGRPTDSELMAAQSGQATQRKWLQGEQLKRDMEKSK